MLNFKDYAKQYLNEENITRERERAKLGGEGKSTVNTSSTVKNKVKQIFDDVVAGGKTPQEAVSLIKNAADMMLGNITGISTSHGNLVRKAKAITVHNMKPKPAGNKTDDEEPDV